jgi:hypothetical protein
MLWNELATDEQEALIAHESLLAAGPVDTHLVAI